MTEARTYMDGYTDHLKARLRAGCLPKGIASHWGALQMEAADALEAAQAEIERLATVVNLQVENYAELKEQYGALEGYFYTVTTDRDAALARLAELEKQEPMTAPPGYKFVVVPEVEESEPDWDEVRRQSEVATGLRVEKNTYSIIIREVRRWIASTYAAAGAAPVQPSESVEHRDELAKRKPEPAAETVGGLAKAVKAARGGDAPPAPMRRFA